MSAALRMLGSGEREGSTAGESDATLGTAKPHGTGDDT
jgi:hypothetical protein